MIEHDKKLLETSYESAISEKAIEENEKDMQQFKAIQQEQLNIHKEHIDSIKMDDALASAECINTYIRNKASSVPTSKKALIKENSNAVEILQVLKGGCNACRDTLSPGGVQSKERADICDSLVNIIKTLDQIEINCDADLAKYKNVVEQLKGYFDILEGQLDTYISSHGGFSAMAISSKGRKRLGAVRDLKKLLTKGGKYGVYRLGDIADNKEQILTYASIRSEADLLGLNLEQLSYWAKISAKDEGASDNFEALIKAVDTYQTKWDAYEVDNNSVSLNTLKDVRDTLVKRIFDYEYANPGRRMSTKGNKRKNFCTALRERINEKTAELTGRVDSIIKNDDITAENLIFISSMVDAGFVVLDEKEKNTVANPFVKALKKGINSDNTSFTDDIRYFINEKHQGNYRLSQEEISMLYKLQHVEHASTTFLKKKDEAVIEEIKKYNKKTLPDFKKRQECIESFTYAHMQGLSIENMYKLLERANNMESEFTSFDGWRDNCRILVGELLLGIYAEDLVLAEGIKKTHEYAMLIMDNKDENSEIKQLVSKLEQIIDSFLKSKKADYKLVHMVLEDRSKDNKEITDEHIMEACYGSISQNLEYDGFTKEMGEKKYNNLKAEQKEWYAAMDGDSKKQNLSGDVQKLFNRYKSALNKFALAAAQLEYLEPVKKNNKFGKGYKFFYDSIKYMKEKYDKQLNTLGEKLQNKYTENNK